MTFMTHACVPIESIDNDEQVLHEHPHPKQSLFQVMNTIGFHARLCNSFAKEGE